MIDARSNGMEQPGAVLPVSQDSFLMQVNGYLMSHSVENFDLSIDTIFPPRICRVN